MRDYDQDPIVVYTPYTFEQVKQFQRVHHRKRKRNAIGKLAFVIVLIALSLIFPSPAYSTRKLLQFITSCFFANECYKALFFNGNFYTPKLDEQYKNIHRGGAQYQFMNDHYASIGEDGDYKLTKDSPYDDVLTIVETHDFLYLYTVPSQAQIIDKAGIRNNSSTPEALSAFLREKFDDAPYYYVG